MTNTITLTDEEAGALRAVLARVGGKSEGPRGLIDNIYREVSAFAKPYGWTLSRHLDGRPDLAAQYHSLYFVEGEDLPW